MNTKSKEELSMKNKSLKITCIILITIPLLIFGTLYLSTYTKYRFLHSTDSFADVSVQIVNLPNGCEANKNITAAELQDSFDIVTTVNDSAAFMDAFQKIEHRYPFGDPNFGISLGYAVLLTYTDGTQELIAIEGCALIDGETAQIQYHGRFIEEEYDHLLKQYLPVD